MLGGTHPPVAGDELRVAHGDPVVVAAHHAHRAGITRCGVTRGGGRVTGLGDTHGKVAPTPLTPPPQNSLPVGGARSSPRRPSSPAACAGLGGTVLLRRTGARGPPTLCRLRRLAGRAARGVWGGRVTTLRSGGTPPQGVNVPPPLPKITWGGQVAVEEHAAAGRAVQLLAQLQAAHFGGGKKFWGGA